MPKETIRDQAGEQQMVIRWGRSEMRVDIGLESLSSYADMRTFDRAAINRMIRVLRSARDQSFGADE